MNGYDRLYVQYLYYFNVERDYFECHEVMEELWLEEGRSPLLQGLLQVAVGLYHHQNGNIGGAVKLFTQAVDKLVQYRADSLGIRLDRLLADADLYLDKLLRFESEPFEFYDITIDIADPVLAQMVDTLAEDAPAAHE